MQQARLLEEQITDADGLLRHIGQDERNGDGHAYQLQLVEERDDEIVVRTIEAKTGLATTHHVRRAALEANEYHRLADLHRELAALTGTPPFTIRLGENRTEAGSFEELRDEVLGIAQKGIDYYRFKGLGEMDAEELRETTMDPAIPHAGPGDDGGRRLGRPGVLDADGRSGGAAAGVHRGERRLVSNLDV